MVRLKNLKSYLGITDTSQDERLYQLVKSLSAWVTAYCKTNFSVGKFVESTRLSFSKELNSILYEGASALGFEVGDLIFVSGTVRNNGYFHIDEVSDSGWKVEERVSEEFYGRRVKIVQCVLDDGLIGLVTDMVEFLYNSRGKTSESLGDYSVNYESFPEHLRMRLDTYKKGNKIVGYSVR